MAERTIAASGNIGTVESAIAACPTSSEATMPIAVSRCWYVATSEVARSRIGLQIDPGDFEVIGIWGRASLSRVSDRAILNRAIRISGTRRPPSFLCSAIRNATVLASTRVPTLTDSLVSSNTPSIGADEFAVSERDLSCPHRFGLANLGLKLLRCIVELRVAMTCLVYKLRVALAARLLLRPSRWESASGKLHLTCAAYVSELTVARLRHRLVEYFACGRQRRALA